MKRIVKMVSDILSVALYAALVIMSLIVTAANSDFLGMGVIVLFLVTFVGIAYLRAKASANAIKQK